MDVVFGARGGVAFYFFVQNREILSFMAIFW